jgi:hypothetical protein
MPRGETTRQKIEKVNATISSLMREMQRDIDTEQYIDWGDLINRLKQYRSDLEDDLIAEEGGLHSHEELSTIEPLPESEEFLDSDSQTTLADTSPPPHHDLYVEQYQEPPDIVIPENWSIAKEQEYQQNPDALDREEFFDVDEFGNRGYIDDEEDFIQEPSDDELYDDDEEN